MAQDFKKVYKSQVTDSAGTLLTADSNDALIGIRLTNITTSAITVDVWFDVAGAGSTASIVYIADDLSIAPKSSVELIQGGAKMVMQSTDELHAQASAADSCAIWVSYVDAISSQGGIIWLKRKTKMVLYILVKKVPKMVSLPIKSL